MAMRETSSHAIGRFAPSPTGALHFGSLMVALGSWLHVRAGGGKWLVRMEDLDRSRCLPGLTEEMLSTLHAHGLASDLQVVHQSDDRTRFDNALAQLVAQGHAFACHCSRRDVLRSGGVHRHCVHQTPRSSAGTAEPSWRFRAPESLVEFEDRLQGPQRQNVAQTTGDFVIRRSNGEYTYQLATVIDDASQCITEVVRGGDLLDSTPRQILLQRALGLPQPDYAHLPMIVDIRGVKLSKQARSAPVDPGNPLPGLRAALAVLGQQVDRTARDAPELLSAALAQFDFAALPHASTLPAPQYCIA